MLQLPISIFRLLLLIVVLPLLAVSCDGNDECEMATVCVFNGTGAIIDGCWNCNQAEITLPPGESACTEIARGDGIVFNQLGGPSTTVIANSCQVVENLQ